MFPVPTRLRHEGCVYVNKLHLYQVYQAVLDRTWLYLAVPDCTRPYQAVLDCTRVPNWSMIMDTCIMETCIIDSCIIDIYICIIAVKVETEELVNFAWVTRHTRPECPKDEVKRPEGTPPRSWGPESP